MYAQGCKHQRWHASENQTCTVTLLNELAWLRHLVSLVLESTSVIITSTWRCCEAYKCKGTVSRPDKYRVRIICHLRFRTALRYLPFICPCTPVSYLLLWVDRSRIRMAPPVLCSAVSRGSASTFCRGSGIPAASLGQGNTSGVPLGCPPSPIPFTPDISPPHSTPLPVLPLLPLAPQWPDVQRSTRLGTSCTALPLPESHVQRWS